MEQLPILPTRARHPSHGPNGAGAPAVRSASSSKSFPAHVAATVSIADARQRRRDRSADGAPVTSGGGATPHSVTPYAPTASLASASPDPQPFLRQRRLPSILLDSWEFRKLAAEGSVLANAMVSYDVDDDGLEEVIVGTTEGLLCVVKPDCREPLFMRALAATISVVLYTPIQSRLVLVTLEGQCEVTDHFLRPTQLQQAGSEPVNINVTLPTDGVDGGAASAGGQLYQGNDSANSLPRASSSRNGGGPSGSSAHSGGATPSPHSAAVSLSTEGFIPTHVFHVPSNCLCADLSPDRDADLVFLGSYDRRLYIYSLVNGSCLLSLFVHDPITSVKAFAIPTSAADVHSTTTSLPICVYDHRALTRGGKRGSTSGSRGTLSSSSAGTGALGILDDAPREAEASPDRVAKASASPYISLVFISTPTHLILLPGGLSDIQQWCKLQPKSAHLPLTVQLHRDDCAATLPRLQRHQLRRKHTRRRTSTRSGKGATVSTALVRSAAARHGDDGSHPREGETALPPHTTRAPLVSTPSLRLPLMMSADTTLGDPLWFDAAGERNSSHPRRHGGSDTECRRDCADRCTGEGHRTSDVSVPVATATAAVAAEAGTASSLSSSQRRRQARRRAIQAAEMGRPVLVKPLWALHIGSQALDVPLLQTMPGPDDNAVGDVASVAPAAKAGALQSSGAAAGTATGEPSACQPCGGERPFIGSAHDSLADTTVGRRAVNSSFFSVSSQSSASALHRSVSASGNTNGILARSDTLAPSSLADAVAVSPKHGLHRASGQGGDGGEETEVSYPSPTSSATAAAAEQNIRRLSSRRLSSTLSPQILQDSTSNSSDGEDQVAGLQSSSSGDDDDDTGLLSNDGARSSGGSVAPVMKADGMADRERKEDDNDDGDNGAVANEDFELDKSGTSTTSTYNSGSDACDRSSSGEVYATVATGGPRVLANSSTHHSRHHHQGTVNVGPALLVPSVPHKRAQSVPTMLLSRTRIACDSDHGSGNCGCGGLLSTFSTRTAAAHLSLEDLTVLHSQRHTRRHHRSTAVREDEGDRRPSRHRHPQRLAFREHYARQHQSARGTSPLFAAAASSPDCAKVPMPTSLDVAVGASQVAVALSCEDGLALELRFSVVRLSSLSRCERRLPRGTVRLYDMRGPRLRSRESASAGYCSAKNAGPGVEVVADDGSAARSASSPASPGSARSFKPCSSHASELPQQRRKGPSQVTYNIFLPTPTTRHAGTAAALSSLSYLSGAPLASERQRQGSRNSRRSCGGVGGALATTEVMSTPATVNAISTMGSRLMADDTGYSASATANHRLGGVGGDATRLEGGGATVRNIYGSLAEPYGKNTVVLRAQCRWAARLSDSPLVQRARVFRVRDSYSQNTFCSVFVAANGTCFAVDGDTLSVVKCCVKEDCSSFTLMTGPLSTAPMLSTRPSVATLRDSSADASAFALDGALNAMSAASSASTMTLSLLRGAVGRTVSCVCVSIDELCVYSVGETNQLCQHRDGATGTVVTPGAKESISLLSRCLPNNSYARVVKGSGSSTAQSIQEMDGAAASFLTSTDPEEQALLCQLAMRLRQHEQCASAPSHHGSGTGAGATWGGERAVETDKEVLTRVKQMLLYDYSEQEWEKLQSIEHTPA